MTASDIARFQACYGTHTQVTPVKVNGGASGQQSGEAALDIETVIGFAPDLRVLLYQMPQLDTTDVYKGFSEAIAQNTAQVSSPVRSCRALLISRNGRSSPAWMTGP